MAFLEDRSTNREGWKYTYTGKDLLPGAQAKFKEAYRLEKEARERSVTLTRDMNIPTSDSRIRDVKADIEKYGMLREQCAVFVTEFTRQPDREYHLAMGDVVFFNLLNLGVDAGQ